MFYQLMYDNAAGLHKVYEHGQITDTTLRQVDYFQEVGLFTSKVELKKAIQNLAGKTVYAVFENSLTGEAFIGEENSLTGNWRGNKYGRSSCAGEYDTREEAEAHLKVFYQEKK